MSSRRKFTTEFKVEAAHRVIDSGRSIAEVAREVSVGDQFLTAHRESLHSLWDARRCRSATPH